MLNHDVAVSTRKSGADRVRVTPHARTLAMLIVAVRGGCASPFGGGQESTDLVCNSPQQCRVIVEVTCPPDGCRASVDHPRVFARNNDVVWIIQNKPGQAYAFAATDGIEFKTQAGRDVFRCHPEANGSRYACMNGKVPGTYEYGVRIAGTPPVAPLDPWVVN